MDFNKDQADEVQKFYGNRLRLRACAICVHENSLLLVKHDLGAGDLWLPPGGGIQEGETAIKTLKRELEEETGLSAKKCDFLFACEFIRLPLHAVELFFRVSGTEGKLITGFDPEVRVPQVILETRFLPWDEIARMSKSQLHGIFGIVGHPSEILDLRGYFTL